MLEAVYIFAVIIAAMSGALTAAFRDFDWIGTSFLATVTALGGGTLRDILLNRTVFWIEHPHYVWIAILTSVVTILYAAYCKPPLKLLLVCDSVGLAFFTILGAQITEAYSSSWVIITLMALITGVAGGLLRDVFANEVPALFSATEPLYSITALAGALCYILLNQFRLDINLIKAISITLIILLRLYATCHNTRLPHFRIKSV